jgi:hypothetical protein
VDADAGYRNGHGKPWRLTLSSGTITVRRPRVRDLDERFESRVLPLFAKRMREVERLIPELYRHGLAEGAFDLALRGLLGADAGGVVPWSGNDSLSRHRRGDLDPIRDAVRQDVSFPAHFGMTSGVHHLTLFDPGNPIS